MTTSYFLGSVREYLEALDALYEDELNRPVRLIDAMYIVNERPSGRSVDVAGWRN